MTTRTTSTAGVFPSELHARTDGLWLKIDHPDGRSALLNLTSPDRPHIPFINRILQDLWRDLLGQRVVDADAAARQSTLPLAPKCEAPLSGPLGTVLELCQLDRGHAPPCRFRDGQTPQDLVDRAFTNRQP